MTTRHERAACPRCGIVRNVKPGRGGDLCRDCWFVEPGWPQRARREVDA